MKSDFEKQQELVGQHLRLGARMNEVEGKISLLTRRVRDLEKLNGPKPETEKSFRARVLAALGAKG